MKYKTIFFSLLFSILLASCSFNQHIDGLITITFDNDSGNNNYYSPDEVTLEYTNKSLQDLTGKIVMPSTGDVNVLVIPIIIKGYEAFATESYLNLLDQAFNSDDLLKGGYPSLKRFYRESSFGQLNIHADILPWIDLYDKGYIPNTASLSDLSIDEFCQGLEKIMYYVYTLDLDFDKYDSDKDGYLDQVYFVYSAYDYQINSVKRIYNQRLPSLNQDAFWSYTVSVTKSYTSHASHPVLANYTVTSFDSLLSGYGKNTKIISGAYYYNDVEISESNDLSPHTLIHETGHAMGLSDYYNYGSDSDYSPMGKLTMMDYNAGDFDAYSKMILGWIKPYVVYGSSEITLLNSQENINQCIVILDDTLTNIFNPFSEYLLIEYYSPKGINQYDINKTLNNYRPLPSNEGYKLYHVDNRGFTLHGNILSQVDDFSKYSGNLYFPITNTLSGERSELSNYPYASAIISNSFDEIRLIEQDSLTFNDGGYFTNDTLFYHGDTFTFEKYQEFFQLETLNSFKPFSSKISFN